MTWISSTRLERHVNVSAYAQAANDVEARLNLYLQRLIICLHFESTLLHCLFDNL
jgi:hypothetical protein